MEQKKSYEVLATKYRPKTFDDLIGQDVLVRTLTNAIEQNRIANAFLLTGIRGVGKTTTARIVAKALNCIGEDGKSQATPRPCGVCSNCRAIAGDRHPDVLEMDAASRTGVDDIREIIDSVNYLPTSARYKVYIIDEVHMLSKNAFNALLKTLEEPPPHVKFIFATTEIRKIPITILSRCQRFDLRRIEAAQLAEHLGSVTTKEGASVEAQALSLIADVAEGSVRDALSLLDQAISQNVGDVSEAMVRNMLGLADSTKIIDLFEAVVSGNIANGLELFKELYHDGADPVLVLQELLEFTYLITKVRVIPQWEARKSLPEKQYNRAKTMSQTLGIGYLSRVWQMLLKGLGEVRNAPQAYIAAEMLLIRLAHLSDLPSPAALVKDIQKGAQNTGVDAALAGIRAAVEQSAPKPVTSGSMAYAPSIQPQAASQASPETLILNNYNELAELFKKKGEVLLYGYLTREIRLVKFERGMLEIHIPPHVPSDISGRIVKHLNDWTGMRWVTVVSQAAGQPTLAEQQNQNYAKLKHDIAQHPEVKKVLDMFPGAKIKEVRAVKETV